MKATLHYLIPTGEKPIYLASTGGADAQLSISAEFAEHVVEVHDARQLSPEASLDQQGFTLLEQITGIEDFYDFEAVRDRYEAEIRNLILTHTGASNLVIFDHTLRSDSAEIRRRYGTREAASVIHNDYTDASAEIRLRDILDTEQAEQRLQRRFAIVNAWRSINHPVESSPLSCCDAQTLSPSDLVASERRASDRIGELELVTWNPAHQWYYFPVMQRDEVLLIKTFDTAKDGRARRSIHTAFDNPEASTEAPPRESIETRALIFW